MLLQRVALLIAPAVIADAAMCSGANVRPATHAGSWYASDGARLRAELEGYMKSAQCPSTRVRALIAPHAGYSYSGPTAGKAYGALCSAKYSRVVLLGPWHAQRRSAPGVQLSAFGAWDTPLGRMAVEGSNSFAVMDMDADAEEHSLEMQMPFLAAALGNDVSVTPLYVSEGYTADDVAAVRDMLTEDTLLVISSDFCHWGARFRYTSVPRAGVEAMDRSGMDAIESGDRIAFLEYLKRTGNTICGRHPILFALDVLEGTSGRWSWPAYA